MGEEGEIVVSEGHSFEVEFVEGGVVILGECGDPGGEVGPHFRGMRSKSTKHGSPLMVMDRTRGNRLVVLRGDTA